MFKNNVLLHSLVVPIFIHQSFEKNSEIQRIDSLGLFIRLFVYILFVKGTTKYIVWCSAIFRNRFIFLWVNHFTVNCNTYINTETENRSVKKKHIFINFMTTSNEQCARARDAHLYMVRKCHFKRIPISISFPTAVWDFSFDINMNWESETVIRILIDEITNR